MSQQTASLANVKGYVSAPQIAAPAGSNRQPIPTMDKGQHTDAVGDKGETRAAGEHGRGEIVELVPVYR